MYTKKKYKNSRVKFSHTLTQGDPEDISIQENCLHYELYQSIRLNRLINLMETNSIDPMKVVSSLDNSHFSSG